MYIINIFLAVCVVCSEGDDLKEAYILQDKQDNQYHMQRILNKKTSNQ